MIDLSYKKRDKKDDEGEYPLIVQFWILVIFSAFLALIIFTGIAGGQNF